MRNRLVCPLLLLLCATAFPAQQPDRHFVPGKWEIDSITTAADGRAVSSTTNICAKEQIDFWNVVQPGMSCKPPVSRPNPGGGFHVTVLCIYNGPSLHSTIKSDVIETFSANGNSFTLTGTSATDTQYQGVRPSLTSIQLESKAHRLGPCD